MADKLLIWAYDGSGIALRVPVKALYDSGKGALVCAVTSNAEIQKALKASYGAKWLSDKAWFTAPWSALTPIDAPPPLASWNWND